MSVSDINDNLTQAKLANLGDTYEDKKLALSLLVKQGLQKTITGEIQINDPTDFLRVINMDNEVSAQQSALQEGGGGSLPTLKTSEAEAMGVQDYDGSEESQNSELDLSTATDEEIQNMASKLMGAMNQDNYDSYTNPTGQ